jgi:6-phosphogluconolactonase (cycloisomerase 2 family)
VWSVGFHPSGKYLYAALRTTNATRPYKINRQDGSLTSPTAPTQVVQEPMSVAVTPDGRWAYIANRNSGSAGTIGLFAIDQQTGALIPPASPFLDGIEPVDLRIDPSGNFLYSANSGTDTISVFSIQSSDGFLQPLTPAPTGVSPSSLVLLQRWQ